MTEPDAWILECRCGEHVASTVDADQVMHTDSLEPVQDKEALYTEPTMKALIQDKIESLSEYSEREKLVLEELLEELER